MGFGRSERYALIRVIVARRSGLVSMLRGPQMRNITLLLILCGILGSATVQVQLPTGTQSPDQVAISFYRWYLHEIDEGRIPVIQSTTQIKEYVSSTLLDALKPRKGVEGPDEDFFLKAQDTLDDWASHVMASPPKVTGDTAHTVVTLGATRQSRHQLAVTLINEGGRWKIQGVSAIHNE